LNALIQATQVSDLGHVFPKIADVPRFFDQMQQGLTRLPAFKIIHSGPSEKIFTNRVERGPVASLSLVKPDVRISRIRLS